MKNNFETTSTADDTSSDNNRPYFDVQEKIDKILKMKPGQEKDLALADLKFNFFKQQQGLAFLAQEIFKIMKTEKSDFPEKFKQVVETSRQEYLFSPEQLAAINKIIEEVLKRHDNVDRFYQENNGNTENMYQAICGRLPEGAIETKKGPVSLSFICSNDKDYLLLYINSNLDFIDQEITPEITNEANGSLGFHFSGITLINPNQEFSIIGIKKIDEEIVAKSVLRHEEQHALNFIYLNNLKSVVFKDLALNVEVLDNSDQTVDLVTEYCQDLVLKASELVKDEIIAYKISELKDEIILESLMKGKNSGGLYDYIDRTVVLRDIRIKSQDSEVSSKLLNLAAKIIIDDYEKLIKAGLAAVNELIDKGYRRQEAAEILIYQPLDKWPKVASRALISEY